MLILQRDEESLYAGCLQSLRVDRDDRADTMADDEIIRYHSRQVVSCGQSDLDENSVTYGSSSAIHKRNTLWDNTYRTRKMLHPDFKVIHRCLDRIRANLPLQVP